MNWWVVLGVAFVIGMIALAIWFGGLVNGWIGGAGWLKWLFAWIFWGIGLCLWFGGRLAFDLLYGERR